MIAILPRRAVRRVSWTLLLACALAAAELHARARLRGRGLLAELGDASRLVHAHRAGHIAAAVIDVWEDEPSIDTQLLEMAAIATPHIAGYSLDGKVNAARMVFESFCRYAGKELAWEHEEELPPPLHRELTVIPDRRTPCRSLCEAVLACYDIREDAARLRGRGGEGAAEPIAERFRRLRATYPPRREFFATRVRLEPEDAQVR